MHACMHSSIKTPRRLWHTCALQWDNRSSGAQGQLSPDPRTLRDVESVTPYGRALQYGHTLVAGTVHP